MRHSTNGIIGETGVRAVQPKREIDRAAAQRAVAHLLHALGADLDSEGLRETPRRMVDAYVELLTPKPFEPTTFANDERLTTQIADWIQEQLEPKGVGVVLEAEHLCMSMRGVQKFGATTVTSALHGQVRDDPRTRQEFLALTTNT